MLLTTALFRRARASLVTQLAKNLSAMHETSVWFPGREDPLEKGTATHSSIAWIIPWKEKLGRLQSMELQSQAQLSNFTVFHFRIARTWMQPRCLSTDEWIKKLWCIYTMEHYSIMKRNKFESVLVRWMNLEPVSTQWSKSEREKQILYVNTYIWNLEKW